MILLLYLLFFLSGAAALIYQVAWVRSLSLIFGGSHLAVTVVLAVFMGGLALGSAWIGRRAERAANPLRQYGLLEIGIALAAIAFVGLIEVYPWVYVPLARAIGDGPLPITMLRVGLATVAMIVPTTLMGGTLPVISRFVVVERRSLARHLSLLYGLNTLGAVAGTLAAGFLFLPGLGLGRTLAIAIGLNFVVGGAALALAARRAAGRASTDRCVPTDPVDGPRRGIEAPPDASPTVPYRVVLVGIAISGFCALGYEVLWTRILSMIVGTSVYGFTIMLVAFLSGIGAGSAAYGFLQRRQTDSRPNPRRDVASLGLVEVLVGLSALVVTYFLRDLPDHSVTLQAQLGGGEFAARQTTSFVIAFLYMFVPASLLGVAFPLAATIHARSSRSAAGGVGDVLAWNTVGAILGAAASGFVLVFLFGVERSLQMLAVLQIGIGVWIAASPLRSVVPRRLALASAAAMLVFLAIHPTWGRVWDADYFAIFRNNQREAFDTPERVRDALDNTEVLLYREGINETISVIRPKGAYQAVVVNGKVVASTTPRDLQCQQTLGHVPMLLHPDPRKVFVLGLGTGITLGAVSAHPELEELTLAEIEPSVVDAARTFSRYNHNVLDDPRLRIVHNDGRNFLLTTRERFDVITADPIHPWTRGAGYLYTTEYFELAASRLRAGGVMCQWLPIYELTSRDVATVVRTFAANFRHVLVWLTYYDAELIGSNAPIRIDLDLLERRMSNPAIAGDLGAVSMGTPIDLLSYYVAGSEGLRRFAAAGELNTDDNLRLEFSAPASIGIAGLMGQNVAALEAVRESVAPYVVAVEDPDAERARRGSFERLLQAGRLYGDVHVAWLGGGARQAAFLPALERLRRSFPDYAPGRFLEGEYRVNLDRTPTLLEQVMFPLSRADGTVGTLTLSAVRIGIGPERAAVIFVDNDARRIFGEKYVDAPSTEVDASIRALVDEVLAAANAAYAGERDRAGGTPPSRDTFANQLEALIQSRL